MAAIARAFRGALRQPVSLSVLRYVRFAEDAGRQARIVGATTEERAGRKGGQ